jgi:hypothetical protein
LRAQLTTLTGNTTMRGAEQGTVVLGGVAHLTEHYQAGSPSLAAVTTQDFAAVVGDAFAEFIALVAAGAGDPITDTGMWVPGPTGGVFGNSSRGMNAGGLELRQVVEKGLFGGAAMYHYALNLTEGAITAATIDALAAAWGANELLDPAGALVHSANYSRLMGFHARMAAALAHAKAFAASDACNAERDDAVRDFFRLWEHSLMARVVFYANRGLILAAGLADNDKIEALHQIGEGVGLLLGYRGMSVPQSGPLASLSLTIDDDGIDAIAVALGVDASDLNASTTGTLIEDLDAFAAAVHAVEQVVAEVYGLDAAEIASYRDPVAG